MILPVHVNAHVSALRRERLDEFSTPRRSLLFRNFTNDVSDVLAAMELILVVDELRPIPHGFVAKVDVIRENIVDDALSSFRVRFVVHVFERLRERP